MTWLASFRQSPWDYLEVTHRVGRTVNPKFADQPLRVSADGTHDAGGGSEGNRGDDDGQGDVATDRTNQTQDQYWWNLANVVRNPKLWKIGKTWRTKLSLMQMDINSEYVFRMISPADEQIWLTLPVNLKIPNIFRTLGLRMTKFKSKTIMDTSKLKTHRKTSVS